MVELKPATSPCQVPGQITQIIKSGLVGMTKVKPIPWFKGLGKRLSKRLSLKTRDNG